MAGELADHLRFYAELGVIGVSRDAAWRLREGGTSAPSAAADRETDAASRPTRLEEPRSLPAAQTLADVTPNPEATAATPDDALAIIKHEIGPDCPRCKLCGLGRRQIVFGVGHARARLMFVGEGPGEEEDKQGEPFVGRAGQLLTKIIEAIGLTRDQVYIANVIKCRPPGNRNPEPDEVAACEPFLFRQVDVIKPMVIVPLGKFAAQSLLKTTDPITRLRGRVFQYRGASLIPTFHPAYLLRNPSAKREVWEDMKKVRAILAGD
jgi:uracil-DNA glycosylase